ncbi:phosphate ABC transporter permease subunit PstC [Halapricum sp. CBA1109]|uniref:phosphate ABC transporter permease subunit PstC n=1 Tax=Halapricum sp. CBA1109 TaxID=2668068 RepID=UPI00351BCBC2
MSTVLFGSDPEPGSKAIVSLGLVLIAVTIALFLVQPIFVSYGLFAFLLVVAVGWFTYQAATARLLTLIATTSTVLTIGFITFYLFYSAWPAITENGPALVTLPDYGWFFFLDAVLPVDGSYYNPAGGAVSLIPFFWGTLVVTFIAALVAAPLGVLGALFISEVAGARLRAVIKPGVEVLAGIPSIVYGFIGFTILNTFVQDTFLTDGATFLIAGLVVGIMALPTVVSVSEDALSSVPSSMGDGAVAMGATKWQTMKSISVPAAFSGISAAIILGLGRAIGETMAVAAILAGGTQFADPLFDIFHANMTLTSMIAIQYGNASQSLEHVLFVAGVILFVIVASMSIVSQYIERRLDKKLKGQA